MQKAEKKDKSTEVAKKQLGKRIAECRSEMSQRKLAGAVGLPPSNMKYIEDGVNAPSPEIYNKIIGILKPESKKRKEMDRLYMFIRKVPPPDVCKTMIENEAINEVMRMIDGQILTDTQIGAMKLLVSSFTHNNDKGVAKNG